MKWSLRFHGVGNASAAGRLGSAMATIERDGRPWLTIDCGAEGLDHYLDTYGEYPKALYITHTHLDHVGGFERLFVGAWFDEALRRGVRVYCPASVVPLLHQRVGDYPNVLAEGGVNFWEAFQLVPVGERFWHEGLHLETFAVRHHWPKSAYGLRLPGSVVWTGDTRPIPEVLRVIADAGEVIAHDCGLHGNPSHTGFDDFLREYDAQTRARCILYHYGSPREAQVMREQGARVADPGEVIALPAPRLIES
ncbi:MBL fold metallo-hydrolase [Solilutibacter silvestris]|uniref:MBL fold metallo-hydrolase n=1 Tax=Solilutibacter silvestris TaxID=1645665 RepID=UPI003D327501